MKPMWVAEDVKEITSIPLTNYYNNIIMFGHSKFARPGRLGYASAAGLAKEINREKSMDH